MAAPSTVPELIPGYREVFPIHESELSRVFYAERELGELVVVKQFLGSPDSVPNARFELEADILGSLDHPQIPTLIEDNTDHFSPHFVTEPVGGIQNLGEAAHAISSPLAASGVMQSVLEPIRYIHAQDVVHRDIKPSNILTPWQGQPLLNDFGIAARRSNPSRRAEGSMSVHDGVTISDFVTNFGLEHVAASGLTETGRMVGTLHYAAPEQIIAHTADTASDIYSAGITFYELLWQRLPRPAKTAREFIRSVINDDIDYSVPEDRHIPKPLVNVVERATQPTPPERYQSAGEMQEAIERAVRDSGLKS